MSDILSYLENHPGLFAALGGIATVLGVAVGWIIAFFRKTPAGNPPPPPKKPPAQTEKAQTHFNTYQAALEQGKWADALSELKVAVALDPERFAPFPFDTYEPQQILGAGGFGVVFLCKHPHLATPVVVKSYRTSELDRTITDVFNEANILRKLDHEAIIHVNDCGFADSARTRPFLVMDYFDGESLDSYVQSQGILSPADWLGVAISVARALQVAHENKIWHRDVKPENILVKREAGAWRVKLIDFGLAIRPDLFKAMASTERLQAKTMADKSIAGTMNYAAPEQMGKSNAPVGSHSDVYGFGKTCYYALLGDPDPDYAERDNLPEPWRKFLEKCTAKVENRVPDFATVLAKLRELADLKDDKVVLDPPEIDSPETKPPETKVPAIAPPNVQLLYLKGKGITATGYESEEGFVVLANSQAVTKAVPSLIDYFVKMRKDLRRQQILVGGKDYLVLKENYKFTSCSAAASVLLGNSANGRVLWKNADGRTLKAIQEAVNARPQR